MNWSQPICGSCYDLRYPNRRPVKLRADEAQKCCDCGNATREGIYFRVDPRTVRYPRQEED